MKKFFKIKTIATLLLFFVSAAALRAQDTLDAQIYKNVKFQAHAYAENLFVYRDYGYAIAHTSPLLVQEYGGADEMKKSMKKVFVNLDVLDKQNVIYDVDVAAGTPAEIIDTAQQLQCIVPDTMIVSVIKNSFFGRTASAVPLIGISEDGGQTWYFCFQGEENYADKKREIPTLSSRLVFLPVGKPSFKRGL